MDDSIRGATHCLSNQTHGADCIYLKVFPHDTLQERALLKFVHASLPQFDGSDQNQCDGTDDTRNQRRVNHDSTVDNSLKGHDDEEYPNRYADN